MRRLVARAWALALVPISATESPAAPPASARRRLMEVVVMIYSSLDGLPKL
jgi:hypothetical protein